VLTTTLIVAGEHGYSWTVLALIANIAIAGLVFWFSGAITRALGKAGSRAVSKLSSLLLAAIRVRPPRARRLDARQARRYDPRGLRRCLRGALWP